MSKAQRVPRVSRIVCPDCQGGTTGPGVKVSLRASSGPKGQAWSRADCPTCGGPGKGAGYLPGFHPPV